ncbi:MAG: YihY/virulence factor BrkB family protein [Agrococcus casei]|uniref:YihY/virulence factor BrkB family protein n=1 Tax=Agrococcus casei TaxID=343512 RepID=UPI003F8E4FD4
MVQIIKRVMQLRPVRAYMHYTGNDGPVYAQGMTLSAFFSIFAGLFIAFAVFMQVLGGNVELREVIIESISGQIPGLIQDADGNGVINPNTLVESRAVDIAGVVAAVGIIMTATRWIATSRLGFRAMLGLPSPLKNPVVLKLTDLGVAIGIGLLVLVSSSVLAVTQAFAQQLGLGGFSWLVGFVVQLALDTAIVLLMYRWAGQVRLPIKYLFGSALLSAGAFAVLKFFASMLFGSIANNPLLASIASVFVILIWLGFVNQIYLISLAILAVGRGDGSESRLDAALEVQRERSREKIAADKKAEEERLQRVRDELAELKERDDPRLAQLVLGKQQKKRRKKAAK